MNNYRQWLIPVTLCALSVMAFSCTKEENPLVPQEYSARKPASMTADFKSNLDRNSAEDSDQRLITIAYASKDSTDRRQPPFPILYLLHDYLGDEGYYERFSLQALLDDMFAKGEIGRMLVVTVDASNYFGGSYYRNSGTTGNYADVLESTIKTIENNYRIHTRAGKAARAIGGHGMGGYGAMRYALDHPELFGSISSMSGPLSLGDPAVGTGVWSAQGGVIQTAFAQNGAVVGDPSLYAKLVAGYSIHYDTRNLIAMSSAFSAHPLRVYDSTAIKLVPSFPFNGTYDTIYNYDYYSGRPASANTISFVSQVDTFGVGVDLPFDSVGYVTPSVWALWRDSADVQNNFIAKKQQNPSLWNDVDIYIDVGTEDEYGYLEQNREFHATLTQAGVAHTYEEYGPAGAFPAGHADQLFSRLRKVIKFHSDRLARPDGPSQ